MKVLSVGHTGITVKNLEKSLEFYRDILGLKLVEEPCDMVTDKEESIGLGIPECVHRICLLQTPHGEFVELMEFGNVESPNKEAMPLNQIGQHHISLTVNDIHKVVKELKEKGIEFVHHPVRYEDKFWVLLRDPDGILIELMGN